MDDDIPSVVIPTATCSSAQDDVHDEVVQSRSQLVGVLTGCGSQAERAAAVAASVAAFLLEFGDAGWSQ